MRALKNIAAVLTAASLLALGVPYASATDIYDLCETTDIAYGISQKNIKRLTDKGWQNINIIEADLSDGRYAVKALSNPEDITKLENIKTLSSTHGTLAAVNGDFFSWKWDDKTKGSAVGGMTIDGQMHTSLTSPWNFATVAQNDDGQFIFDYIDCTIAIAAPNGYITPIEHINKYDDLTTPIIYTSQWGPLSPGSTGNHSEIVVENDIITAIHYDVGPVAFPENGYIIGFLRDLTPEIIENFNVGDKVEIGINYEPKFENIQFAIGAGTLLLKDGKKTEITNDIAGYHPRTAIGVSADNSKLYLVTVDGRQASSKGVTLSALADIMLEAGAAHAANLDGGGSTTMVTKSPMTNEQTVINKPSDNYLRPVANGVGIVPVEQADNNGFITIETDSNYIFKGTKAYMNIRVHNSLGYATEYDTEEMTISAPDGKVEDNYYYPETTGEHTVKVSYKGMSAEKTFRIIENPVELATGLKEYNIKPDEKAYITLIAKDEKGYSAYINLDDADITLSSPILEVEGNYLKGKSKGTAIATFNLGDAQVSAIIRVGGDKSPVELPEDIIASPKVRGNEFTFAVFGNTISKNTLTEKLALKKYIEILNNANYELSVFAGDKTDLPFDVTADCLLSDKYSVAEYENATVITLSASDMAQWQNFISDAKTVRTENLILVTSAPVDGDGAYMEEMLIDMNSNLFEEKGVNLFVVSTGDFDITRNSGIRHIRIPGAESFGGAANVLENAHYYEITLSGEEFELNKVKIFE